MVNDPVRAILDQGGDVEQMFARLAPYMPPDAIGITDLGSGNTYRWILKTDKFTLFREGGDTVNADPHHGMNWGPEHPCWHEWDCPGSVAPHRCTFGRGHLIEHHACPCGATTP